MDQALTSINDSPKGEHTGSSRYASAESEEDSNDPLEIQRNSLGPKGADLLRKTFERNAVEAQAGRSSATQFMNMAESEQLNSYFRSAMKQYELEQAHMNAGQSVNLHFEQEIDMPDIDMKSVGSRPNESHDYGHELREQGGKRLPQLATAGAREWRIL